MEIAKTIQKQLLATVGQIVVWSWAQRALQRLSKEDLESLDIKGEGALKFRVSGHHHKGHVLVVLNGKDLYDVYICTIQKGKITIKDFVKDLDFEQFGSYIDEQVEYISEYSA